MNTLNNVLIIGATSAIAEHFARQVVSKGASVVCVGRNNEKLKSVGKDLEVRSNQLQKIHLIEADLTDKSRHEEIVSEAVSELGCIDSILIAHGTLPEQDACQNDIEKIEQELQTNAISVISLLVPVTQYFRVQQKGVIGVISSVAGDRGRQSNYVYGAAKGMLSIYLQGLRNRLHKNSIDVVTIKPGFVDTPMTESFDKKGLLWAKPDTIATGIVNAMQRGRNEVYLPWFWQHIMLIIRHIPEAIFKRLSL